jgi:hypothetical protein
MAIFYVVIFYVVRGASDGTGFQLMYIEASRLTQINVGNADASG